MEPGRGESGSDSVIVIWMDPLFPALTGTSAVERTRANVTDQIYQSDLIRKKLFFFFHKLSLAHSWTTRFMMRYTNKNTILNVAAVFIFN